MSRTSTPLAIWAALLAVLAAVFGIAFRPSALPLLLIAIAPVAALALALALHRAGDRRADARSIPDTSYATALAAFGLGTIVAGLAFGFWLVLLGGGALAFGLGGLVREFRQQRRAR